MANFTDWLRTLEEAEKIVRKLADLTDSGIIDDEYGYCGLCYEAYAKHKVDCPWLMAVEWVRKNPTIE